MKLQTYAYLAVGLLLLAAPAGALIPDNITISASPVWLTAGGDNAATITVQVKNSTSPLEGVGVDFDVDGTYGSISPLHAVTDSDGKAMADFRPGTVAGTAKITATVPYEGPDEPLKESIDLQIDHTIPHAIAGLWYKPEVTAGGEVDITVRMEDRYGNVVDSRREDALGISLQAENVTFMVGSPGGGAAFAGDRDKIPVPVDENGNATARLRVDTVAGENVVYIQPPKPIKGEYISITGTADGMPAGIACMAIPHDASAPANGESKVTLMYTLTDAYGNPAAGQDLWVNSSGLRGDSKLISSSSRGEVWITYGPEDNTGRIAITATAAANPSVTITTWVEFTSTEPVDMLLTASPQTMASRDRNPDVASELRAKVMDIRGNPVRGETVTFEIVSNRSAPFNQTMDQGLEAASAITDADGCAVVRFQPGGFTNDRKAPGWDASATGNAVVRATWENATRDCHVTREINLTWMNYPYLSVETEVSRATISVNSTDGISNTTDVTIRLKGDGYAMRPDPIDVVLVIDRSGSMTGTDVSPTRMKAAQNAAKDFVGNMNLATEDGDRVALVSFAFDARLDQELTCNSNKIKGVIDRLTPDGATNMRLAYYTAVKYLKENGRPEAVKAVILMGDGDWNYHGSPLAKGIGYADNNRYLTSDWYSSPYWAPLSGYRWSGSSYNFSNEMYEWYHDLPSPEGNANVERELGKGKWYDTIGKEWVEKHSLTSLTCNNGQFTNQNMSVYANSGDDIEKVRIYSIGFASKLNSNVEKDLGILSSATGGKYVWAGNETELKKIYTDIAGELKTEAGVDTDMTIFKNVEVNGTLIDAFKVFDYIYKEGESTTIESWIENETGNCTVIPFKTINQTSDWNQHKQLHFDIGTIHLNQTWTTTFRLAVNASYTPDEDNNINIFGDGALISFNNGTEKLELPDTFITIFPDLTNMGIASSSLAVRFTGPKAGSGPYVDLVPLSWTTTYNGTQGVDLSLACSRYEDMRSPATFFAQTLDCTKFSTGDNTATNSTLMDVRGLPPGEYWVTVTASARDARTAEDTTSLWAHTTDSSCSHIRIE